MNTRNINLLHDLQRVLLVVAGLLMLLMSSSFLRQKADLGLLFICSLFFIGGLGVIYLGYNLKK